MDEETLIEVNPRVTRIWRGPRSDLYCILSYIQAAKAVYGWKTKCDVAFAIKAIGIIDVRLVKATTPDQLRGHEADIVLIDELTFDL